jgi:phosphatidylinositol-bisphosphatase
MANQQNMAYQYPSFQNTMPQQHHPPSSPRPAATGASYSPNTPVGGKGNRVVRAKTPNSSNSNNSAGIIMASRAADEETEDGRIRNREASAKIRDAWIYKQIRSRQDDFTQYKQGRVFVGTWNVNAKGKEESLSSWLCADWHQHGPPDIVVVGFQEIVDLNAVNVAVENKSATRSQFWVEKIRSTLNSRQNTLGDPMRTYTELAVKFLVGLLVCVFVKAPHKPRVKYVHSDSVGVGVMGMMGNKGGVTIRLQFYDSTLCFICAHLAAHRENVAGRNADFANVYTKISFEIGHEAVQEVIKLGSMSQWAMGTSSVGVPDHDIVFWFGDLNYRVDESIPTVRVMELSKTGKLDELIEHDQLNIERAAGRVFRDFEEGPLGFRPTYKYQPGTDLYEERPDKKLRAPAWCDRILWLAQEPGHVAQLNYTRSELNVSDHKPVMSTFLVTIKDVILAKREGVYRDVMKMLDTYENNSLPMVSLDRINLDFGEVRYDQRVTLPIVITNTGQVVAQFRLVPKIDEVRYLDRIIVRSEHCIRHFFFRSHKYIASIIIQVELCKSWMTVAPTYGMLIPGEQTEIEMTITIDNSTAHRLNTSQEVLDDVIILRLENGRDYYISVTGKYARSCFGMSVDELVLYTDPVREVPLDPILRAEKYDLNSKAAMCVPKELWRIIDAIFERGLNERDLFTMSGDPDEVYQIRECLDTGASFENFSVHSFAEVLTSFLSNLSSPIIPITLVPTLDIDAQNIQMFTRKFLEDMLPVPYNVFIYIISFFREVLLHEQMNRLSPPKVAR